MRQFDVCRMRPERKGARAGPLMLILQADLLSDLDTRVVAPLVEVSQMTAIGKMRPSLLIAGKRYRLVADRLSVVHRTSLGAVVASLQEHEWEIRHAVDVVFVGV